MIRKRTEIEKGILSGTKKFAKNNDIHYDKMTESMIVNSLREYQFLTESKELNDKFNEKEYEMKFINTGFPVWVKVDIRESEIDITKAIELGFLRVKNSLKK